VVFTAKELYDLASEIIHHRGEYAKISIHMVDKSDFVEYFGKHETTDEFFDRVLDELDDAITDEVDETIKYVFNQYIDHDDEGDE